MEDDGITAWGERKTGMEERGKTGMERETGMKRERETGMERDGDGRGWRGDRRQESVTHCRSRCRRL